MNLSKDMLDEKRAMLVYQPVACMIADGFSNMYGPAEHKIFERMIQGEQVADIKVQTMVGCWDKENTISKEGEDCKGVKRRDS
jgi:hypothetical protein